MDTNTQYKKNFYTPQFSEMAAVSIRRLAWAVGKKMTTTVDHMVHLMLTVYEPAAVCSHCQDKSKCEACIFSLPETTWEEIRIVL
jgi:recombinational DNA repair protein RecR